MTRPPKVYSPEQVKQRLRMQGITITQWAEARGYPRQEVYRVLNGQHKGHFGRAHEIAVALGMKAPIDQSTDAAIDRNLQKVATR